MQIREEINQLIQELSSDDKEVAADACDSVQLLLQATNTSSEDPHLMQDYFRQMLPDQYHGIALSDAEVDEITKSLLRQLDGPPQVVSRVAGGLRYSARPHAVARIAQALRRYMGRDGHTSRQLMFALDELISVLIATGHQRRLTAEEDAYIADACAVLREAAEKAVDEKTKLTAAEQLEVMAGRVNSIGRSC